MTLLTFAPAWAWLLLSALFFACGEYLSKRFALSPSLLLVAATVSVYALGTLAWLPAIFQKNQLAVTGTLWNLLAFATTVGIGLSIFGEHLAWYQWLGLVCAACAIALLSL